MHTVDCPNCGYAVRSRSDLSGTAVACPKCAKRFTVPAAAVEAEPLVAAELANDPQYGAPPSIPPPVSPRRPTSPVNRGLVLGCFGVMAGMCLLCMGPPFVTGFLEGMNNALEKNAAALAVWRRGEEWPQSEHAGVQSLAYLSTVEMVDWVEVEGNTIYLGFEPGTRNVGSFVEGAAVRFHRATDDDVWAWGIDGREPGWRAGDGPHLEKVVVRNGRVE